MARRLRDRHPLELPDQREHPIKYAWVVTRWRIGLWVAAHPIALSVIVALAVCAYPLITVIDQQKQLSRYAKESRRQIGVLRDLTKRVRKIEHPTQAQVNRAIARCIHDPDCLARTGRLNRAARRELRKRGAGRTAPGGPRRNPSAGERAPGRTPGVHTPPRPPDGGHNPGPIHTPTPTPTPAPSPSPTPTPAPNVPGIPHPPNVQVPPVHTPPIHVTPPSVCTPVIGINCP